eukprot:GHVS01063819.1.p1 GENE.GHVS01063819.1~~GHVS01063819.1.p1  ORF type:complete len:176 (+),score=33.76 GHVS01063819.1:54-530(+)
MALSPKRFSIRRTGSGQQRVSEDTPDMLGQADRKRKHQQTHDNVCCDNNIVEGEEEVDVDGGGRVHEALAHMCMVMECLELAGNLLLPDGRIAIYSPHFQPLAAAQAMLTASDEYVHVKLEELFLREHQVLAMRTHPVMGSGLRLFSGFVLTAIKIYG